MNREMISNGSKPISIYTFDKDCTYKPYMRQQTNQAHKKKNKKIKYHKHTPERAKTQTNDNLISNYQRKGHLVNYIFQG